MILDDEVVIGVGRLAGHRATTGKTNSLLVFERLS